MTPEGSNFLVDVHVELIPIHMRPLEPDPLAPPPRVDIINGWPLMYTKQFMHICMSSVRIRYAKQVKIRRSQANTVHRWFSVAIKAPYYNNTQTLIQILIWCT